MLEMVQINSQVRKVLLLMQQEVCTSLMVAIIEFRDSLQIQQAQQMVRRLQEEMEEAQMQINSQVLGVSLSIYQEICTSLIMVIIEYKSSTQAHPL